MQPPEIFEELLASYPPEKRELARQIFHRFTDSPRNGDFFSELCVVLDVYAYYLERIPQAVIAANENALTALAKLRDEVNLLAQGMDKRNLNISNQAARIEKLCGITQAKCDETTDHFTSILQNLANWIDTKEIVSGIKAALETSIRGEVIAPFVSHSEELARTVIPAMRELQEAASSAKALWPGRIWRMAVLSGLSIGVAISILATTFIYTRFNSHYHNTVAEKIAAAERVITANQQAFRQMAIAGVPVHVYRASSDGTSISPGGFALVVSNAQSAETRPDGNGYIFFVSPRKEMEIEQMEQQAETLSGAASRQSAKTSRPAP